MRYILVAILILLILSLLKININHYENFSENIKPKLFVYWEDISGTPEYIKLCIASIFKHCSKSFDIILLNEKNIHYYLPELKNKRYDLSKLHIAQKVDYYRILLLYKYGGLYLDADVLVLRNPIEIVNKLKKYDFVGFGCTGPKCTFGYKRPSNWIMASRPKGLLITNVLNNIESKLEKNNKWGYHNLGKYILWEELDKLTENRIYFYYHYSNHYDGSRDKYGNWITAHRLFSNEPILYKNPDNMIFMVMYNSGMNNYKKMSRDELLYSNMNISKFFRKSLDIIS